MKKHQPRSKATTSSHKLPSDERFPVQIDRRELATILAALRFHQDENLQGEGEIPDLVVRDIANDGGKLVPLSFDEVNLLCQRMNAGDRPEHIQKAGGAICACPDGLLIDWPPAEDANHPLFRVAYVIDVNADSVREAARTAYRIMSDRKSQPPLLHIMKHLGAVVTVDLSAK